MAQTPTALTEVQKIISAVVRIMRFVMVSQWCRIPLCGCLVLLLLLGGRVSDIPDDDDDDDDRKEGVLIMRCRVGNYGDGIDWTGIHCHHYHDCNAICHWPGTDDL